MVVVRARFGRQAVPFAIQIQREVVQGRRLVDVRSLFLHHEVLLQRLQELLRRQSVQVLHHPVVVDDGELLGRETHRHEVIVFLIAPVVRILGRLFSPHQCRCRTPVMSVGNVERRHLLERLRDCGDVLVVVNHPELMAEAVVGCHEIIHRLLCRIFRHHRIEHLAFRVSEEHRFDVRIVHPHMLHAVLFLVASRQLMLLDYSVHVIGHVSPHHQAILRLAVHGLGINIITRLVVLHQPALFLEHPEIRYRLVVHPRVVLVGTFREVNLRLDDVIQ